jgi:mitochondrial enoyl-[acyl-carrier protein] reductase / trans-2-enoyl-CoA reductase
MKRAQYSERGTVPEEFIEAIDFDAPELADGQVLIQVLAAPINPSDVLTLTGLYGQLPPLPAIGGNEGVGRVVQHGPNVSAPALGQMVLLPVGSGTWATHVVAEAKRLLLLPNDADPQQLAMMTVNPPTASLMLSEFVDLQPGDWVIQNAANSGVGAYLIQLAKIRGLKTVNIVRRESALASVQALGADVVLVEGSGLAKRVAEATGGAKIRLGIDAVGGNSTDQLAMCLANSATLVNYGMMSGEACVISPASFVFRNITLRGFWLAFWFRNATPAQQAAVFGEIAGLIAAGKLHTRVQACFDVSEIKLAVAAAAKGEREGKILIVPNA